MQRVAILLAALLHVAVAHVHVLTEKNFKKEVLDSPDYWLVEFYAPWCGHCKQLEPEWKKAAKKLKTTAKLGAVDCTVNQQLAQKFGIQGYPTIKEFGKNKNKPQEYRGGRSAGEIVQHAKSSPLAALGVSSSDTAAQVLQYKDMYTFFAQAPPKTPSAILFGRNKQKKGAKAKPRWLDDVARTFVTPDKKSLLVQFGFVAGSDSKVAKHLGLNEADLPAVVFVDPAAGFVVSSLKDTKPADQVASFVNKALTTDLGAWSPLPSFPPPEDNTPRKKPPIVVAETTASTFENDCLDAADGKLCVLYIPKDPAAFDLRPVAKHFRRDKLSFFWLAPSSPLVRVLEEWTDTTLAPPDNADMTNVMDNAILEMFLSHIVEGLESFRPLHGRPQFSLEGYDHSEL
uniref:Secreted protein n=1 Tax=Achlya hypogyna TaxID=1202772 RepID=A0A0A7CPB1_ACHHY|nr:secreted protein [Achlya hypogyna]